MNPCWQRIAVIADIHGNRSALQAVLAEIDALAEPVDALVVNGDLFSLGPDGESCLHSLQERRDTLFVRGNHERYMLGDPPGPAVPEAVRENLLWQIPRLADATREILAGWPDHLRLRLGRHSIHICHAAPGNDEQVVFPDHALPLMPEDCHCLVLAHIHQPWLRREGELLCVNSGSVGAPLDGDPRASWLLLSLDERGDVQATLQRCEYPLAAAVEALLQSGAPMAETLAHSLRSARIMRP